MTQKVETGIKQHTKITNFVCETKHVAQNINWKAASQFSTLDAGNEQDKLSLVRVEFQYI